MPKIKTRQAVAKRFKVTKNKKVVKRSTGQDHYNARATGAQKRSKRSDKSMNKTDSANLKTMMPYN